VNHYETLGVEKSATDDEIKKSYKKLASKLHPDKPGGDTQKFQEIQAAYEAIGDAQKRAQYDAALENGGRPQFHFHTNNANQNGVPPDIAELLRRQFGFDASAFTHQNNGYRAPQRNQDIRIMVQIELVDTLAEQTKTLAITFPTGEKENVEIKIPRGIQSGETIRYVGLGSNAIPTIPRADLYVQFHVKGNIDFEQDGVDLYRLLNVNCLEAMVGCVKEIVGIDGKKFNLTIPPGSQHNTKFGISDAGLYVLGKEIRGRLIAVLNIYIPTKLSDEQLKIIKDIQITL